MFRGYRRTIFAAVGLALLGGNVLAQPVRGNASNQPAAQQRQNQPAPNPPPILSPTVQDSIERAARAIETTNDPEDAAADRKRAQKDLKAQQDMAFWAMSMFFAAIADTVLTLVGVILIWLTLIYTRDTATAAKDAVSEAKRQANAAEAALAAADRPHIVVDHIETSEFDDSPGPGKDAVELGYQFGNHGEDLGFLRARGMTISVCKEGETYDRPQVATARMYWPLAPNRAWVVALGRGASGMNLTQEMRVGILAGKRTMFCSGQIEYTGTSGDMKHIHRFVYIYRVSDKTFVPYEDEEYWIYT